MVPVWMAGASESTEKREALAAFTQFERASTLAAAAPVPL